MEIKTVPSVPRRYEDTKPALNQAFTHSTILDIGEKISLKSQENNDYNMKQALNKCEEEVWKEAEVYKDECVTAVLKEAKAKEDQRVKHIERQHEKTLKRELARTEEIVHHQGVEKLVEQKQAAEKRLNEVVTKLHSNFAVERDAAVEATRKEEKELAEQIAKEVDRQYQAALQTYRDEQEEDKHNKMEEVRQQMTLRMKEEISKTELRQQEIASDRINQISAEYEKMIEDMKRVIEEMKEKQRKTENAFTAMENLKNTYASRLKSTKEAFVAFIEECRPDFSSGQADYLIPSDVLEPDDDCTLTARNA